MDKVKNNVIITGMLVSKDRCADNRDIKRPVLDFEVVVRKMDGETLFESLPVLLPGGHLARSIPGYRIGEIFVISGCLRCGEEGELYIEAAKIVRISEEKKHLPSLAMGRADLLRLEMCPNFACIAGDVEQKDNEAIRILVERARLSPGDLAKCDHITVETSESADVGERVFCTGQVCRQRLLANELVRVSV